MFLIVEQSGVGTLIIHTTCQFLATNLTMPFLQWKSAINVRESILFSLQTSNQVQFWLLLLVLLKFESDL